MCNRCPAKNNFSLLEAINQGKKIREQRRKNAERDKVRQEKRDLRK